jgi:hypothetical protein
LSAVHFASDEYECGSTTSRIAYVLIKVDIFLHKLGCGLLGSKTNLYVPCFRIVIELGICGVHDDVQGCEKTTGGFNNSDNRIYRK